MVTPEDVSIEERSTTMPTSNGSYLCIEFRLPFWPAGLFAESLLVNNSSLANNTTCSRSMYVRP